MGDSDLRHGSIGALAGLLMLGVAACGPAPGPADGANASAPGNAAAEETKRPVEPAPPALVLEGAGLRIPGGPSPRTVSFDTPKSEAIEALTKALGRPPTELGSNDECGGGGMDFAAWEGEITAWFLDGRFAGWDNKGKLKTLEGVGLGSRRSDLAGVRGFQVEESTLGTEFRAGGLSGILDSAAADAKVTHLWGGATCVFR